MWPKLRSSGVLPVLCLLLLLLSCVAASGRIHRQHSPAAAPSTPFTPSAAALQSTAAPTWSIDTSRAVHAVNEDLYGIFFEEYSYSGEGGLYQQQIQNTNFETTLSSYAPWATLNSSAQYTLQLDTRQPLNGYNPTSLLVTTKGKAGQQAGVINPGFWGISMRNRTAFDITLHARSATIASVVAALTSADGAQVYGSITFSGITSAWTALRGQIKVSSDDPAARFQVTYQTTADTDRIAFDAFELMPTNGWSGLRFIRPDLGQLLADMKPSFVRFPGGCYVEGDRLSNRYNWKRAIGPMEERTGHWNFWGYFSQDGLGPYEYFSWVEKLTDAYGQPTRSIWVVNNGLSLSDSVPNQYIDGWVQDALDSIEFITGSATSEWGSIRASMGHPEPFGLQYVAINNEVCGHRWYEENYRSFYTAINASYPNITLISNCDPTQIKAEVQLWDYHIYTNAMDFVHLQNYFDTYPRTGAKVFNSEYAVDTKGQSTTQLAALGEAAWMTGLERNADLVTTSAYAPLLNNVDAHATDFIAIVYDRYRYFVTPSYWNQVLWAQSFTDLVPGSVSTLNYSLPAVTNVSVTVVVGAIQPARSLERYAGANTCYVHKVVNLNAQPLAVTVDLRGLPSGATVSSVADVVVLSASDYRAHNSFEQPTAVQNRALQLNITGPTIDATFEPYSVTVVRVYATL